MTGKENHKTRKPIILKNRAKYIWYEFLKNTYEKGIILGNGIDEINNYDIIEIDVPSNATPESWGIRDKKVKKLEVEIIWTVDPEWEKLLNYIKVINNEW